MNNRYLHSVAAVLLTGAMSVAQGDKPTFDRVATDFAKKLESSELELDAVRNEIADVRNPMNQRLAELDAELREVRAEWEAKDRLAAAGDVEIATLEGKIKKLKSTTEQLANVLTDYVRKFETRIHIAEKQRYEDVLHPANIAVANASLSERDVFDAQAAVIDASFARIESALGGESFEGSVVGPDGLVVNGTVALLGPMAIFRSEDGTKVGTVEQRWNSFEPSVLPFFEAEDVAAATELITTGNGSIPLDASLGDAHTVAEVESETFLEHVQKGGPVMYPIFGMAGLALLVAIYRWIVLSMVRRPSKKQLGGLLAAVKAGDHGVAQTKAKMLPGPAGKMLAAGSEHLGEPRELVEEVMYESVLKTRLDVNKLLPFIAICAAAAPLLGLLGTVTGIINTFKMITIFGSSDVKSLSGGISEALITTKFGLIVAIPSLLLHAYLSRKARGIVSTMEKGAMAFVNHIPSRSSLVRQAASPQAEPSESAAAGAVDPEMVRSQVSAILEEVLAPLSGKSAGSSAQVG